MLARKDEFGNLVLTAGKVVIVLSREQAQMVLDGKDFIRTYLEEARL